MEGVCEPSADSHIPAVAYSIKLLILSLATWCRKHKEDLVQKAQACSSHRTVNTCFVFLFLCSTATVPYFAKKLDDYRLTCALIIKHLCGSIYLTFSMQISTCMLK